MSQVKYGFRGKIYFNGGSYNAPTWNEVKFVREVKVGAAFQKQDATTRAGRGLSQSEPILLDIGLTGKVRTSDQDSAGFVAMESAFLSRGLIDVMILDGDKGTDGNRGYRVDMKVFKFDEDQGNDQLLWRDFEIAPCVSDNEPQKVLVQGSSPVFSSLAA